ncbi:MAG: YjbQ family protein [Chloroflexi bacterium]|nr:YjbQ family protein [Chloroflexota bacterium]
MNWHKGTLNISTHSKGMYAFTDAVNSQIQAWEIQEGMCFLYIQHTSASLCISESYDPSAREDLETFMDRLVPERQIWHHHTLEGPDDSPSHMRAILTDTDLTIPIDSYKLNLGTWQGVYLFEHRTRPHLREVLIRCLQIT